ncbi:Flagellar assembly protein FliH [Burkholderiales bacterium]|nr:MAG: flagellar assembly protein FliH [Burkholderiales bacterium]CAG0964499.1 Flagellar assembly protein FliH [Burkholderiales bacterium]
MKSIIPKEQLTAYERWELLDFSAGGKPRVRQEALPTVAAVQQIQAQAREEGLAAGLKEGYAAGVAKAAHEAQALHALLQPLADTLRQLDEELAQEVLTLALHVAREVVRGSLNANPDLVLPVVREAIRNFDAFNQHPQLILNPADADLVKTQLADQLQHGGWRLREDPLVERGGCRVETHTAEVDATLATRWQRVLAALGQDLAWAEP